MRKYKKDLFLEKREILLIFALKKVRMDTPNNKISPQKLWIPMKTIANTEIKLKAVLEKMNIEHFIPSIKAISKHARQLKEVDKPIIHNLIFIHASWKDAFLFQQTNIRKVSFIYQRNREKIIIPDKDMEQFITFISTYKDEVKILNNPVIGDKVRIKSGELENMEGYLVKEKNKNYFYVRLTNMCSAGIAILKKNVVKVKETTPKTKTKESLK